MRELFPRLFVTRDSLPRESLNTTAFLIPQSLFQATREAYITHVRAKFAFLHKEFVETNGYFQSRRKRALARRKYRLNNSERAENRNNSVGAAMK